MIVALSFWKLHADPLLAAFGQRSNPHDQETDVTVLLQNAMLRDGGASLALPLAGKRHFPLFVRPCMLFQSLVPVSLWPIVKSLLDPPRDRPLPRCFASLLRLQCTWRRCSRRSARSRTWR